MPRLRPRRAIVEVCLLFVLWPIFGVMLLLLLIMPKNHGLKKRRRTLDEEDAATVD